jgi:hypothetical protein
MISKLKIALQVDYPGSTNRHYSFPLKQDLTIEPGTYSHPRRMYVLTEAEGNFQSFCNILVKRKIINKYLKWTFDDRHLVIIGNAFCRNEQLTDCLWLIYSLEEQARREGGYIHFLLGTHELDTMKGNWHSMHPQYAIREPGDRTPGTALYNGNYEIFQWLRTKNLIEKIGPILFVHGGISPDLTTYNLSISDINRKARAYYIEQIPPSDGSIVSLLLSDNDGLANYRGYFDGSLTETEIDRILDTFDVRTIVTGHVLGSQTSTYFNGKIINVCLSESAGLYIKNERFHKVTIEGKMERIK